MARVIAVVQLVGMPKMESLYSTSRERKKLRRRAKKLMRFTVILPQELVKTFFEEKSLDTLTRIRYDGLMNNEPDAHFGVGFRLDGEFYNNHVVATAYLLSQGFTRREAAQYLMSLVRQRG